MAAKLIPAACLPANTRLKAKMRNQPPLSASFAEPRAENVWVFGLDGASFSILDSFVKHGWMPNLAHMMHAGTTASLRSTLPPVSAPAWTSFLTGCNPGRHGVYTFRSPMRGNWERSILNAAAIRVPRIWQFLGLFNCSTGLINVPMTYPVEPLNGYMVAGMLTPDGNAAVAYPEDIQQKLRSQNYTVDLHIGRHERKLQNDQHIILLADDLRTVVQKRTHAALHLLEQRPTTFFTLVFVAADRIQHYAWRSIESLIKKPEAAQNDRVCQRILALYQELDRSLGALQERAGENTAIFVVSDHGFCGVHTRVHLNEWLAQKGWLEFRQGAITLRRHLKRKRNWIKRLVPRRLLLWGRRTLAVTHTLAWTRTSAYTGGTGENTVYINLRGREPGGIISDGEPYQRLRSEVAAALAGLRDPRNGRPVMKDVRERENAYTGNSLDAAPDIVFEPAEGYEITPEVSPQGDLFVDTQAAGQGIHAQTGILIAAGAGIQRMHNRGQAEIMDLAPTVLYLLGLPVPCEMDGRILDEMLDPDWLSTRPPQRLPLSHHLEIQSRIQEQAASAEQRRRLEERLGDLGYLE